MNVIQCSLFCLAFLFHGVNAQLPIRFCVPKILDHECISMRQDVGQSKIECIFARDRLQCMEKIQRNAADLIGVDANDVYTAGKEYGLVAYAMEEVKRSDYLYRSVAVVKKTANIDSLHDLRKKNSCHGGWGKTAGWNVPIGVLLEKGVMDPDCRGELYTVSRFFNSSCAPGPWSPSSVLDTKLKQDHPSLCSLCNDPLRCLTEDSYAGNVGTLKCLVEGKGDVAFTTPEAVQDYLNRYPRETNNLQYLCLDGTRKGMMESPCSWADKPTNVFMGSPKRLADSQASFHRTLSQIFNDHKSRHPSWFEKVLVAVPDTTDLLLVPTERQAWAGYLGNYRNAIERSLLNCKNKTITFCTTSEVELNKCREFALAAYARNIRPEIGCSMELSKEACIQSVASRKSDLITLDAGDIFRAGRDQDLKPIAREIYKDLESSYFAVAVIKQKSKVNEISDLKGLRSCHSMIGQTSSWIMPVATLLEEELIPVNVCDRLASVSGFFGASCLPGANNTRFNRNETVAEILCRQCAGNDQGEHRCSRSLEERYSGEAGAFRCLAEDQGDVAFLRHTTPIDFTDGKSRFRWTANLHSRDFKLLCRHGGTSNLHEYETCHLSRIPSHHIMISEKAAEEVVLDAAQLLVTAGETFGLRSKSLTFELFGTYHVVPDLLFKDKTTDLHAVALNETAESVLGYNFNQAMQLMDPEMCNPVGSASHLFISPVLFLLMLLAFY